QVRDQRLRRRLADQSQQGYQHQDPREDGQDAVIRQRRGPVLEEVVLELPNGPPACGQPRVAAQFRRLVRGDRAVMLLRGRLVSLARVPYVTPFSAFFRPFPAPPPPGRAPVSGWVPAAASRSTAALTVAKIAPCSAAAMRISCQPRLASVAFGASSSPAASCHALLKIAPASRPPTMPTSMLTARCMRLVIACPRRPRQPPSVSRLRSGSACVTRIPPLLTWPGATARHPAGLVSDLCVAEAALPGG